MRIVLCIFAALLLAIIGAEFREKLICEPMHCLLNIRVIESQIQRNMVNPYALYFDKIMSKVAYAERKSQIDEAGQGF